MVVVHPTLDAVLLLQQKGLIRLMSSDLQQELARGTLQLRGREPFFMRLLPSADRDTLHLLAVTRGAGVDGLGGVI